jgi:predicted ribosomally synthesized peptide with SipW-like signal peptide
MRKILFSLGMLVFVGAVVVGATGAFFSDTETSTGNVFAAGAIDLLIDNESYVLDFNLPEPPLSPTGELVLNEATSWALRNLDECGPGDENQNTIGNAACLFFDFFDLKPGDYGEDTISLHVQNDAWACMAMDLTGTPENVINEAEDEAGDITDDPNGGELQNYLNFVFWVDDGDNVFEVGEEETNILFQGSANQLDGAWQAIAESGDEPLQAGDDYFVGKFWCFGEIGLDPFDGEAVDPIVSGTGFTCDGSGDNNDAQTDSIVVDVHFYAEQSRNNDEFLCSALEPVGEGRPVGAALASYVDPIADPIDSCDATVGAAESLQTAIGSVPDGGTVCVDPTYDGATDPSSINVNRSVTIAGLGAAGAAVVNAGFIIDANNVTVKGLRVTGGDTEGSFTGFYIKSGVDNLDIVFNDIDGPGVNVADSSRGILNVSGVPISDILVENNTIHEWHSGIYMNPDNDSVVAPWLVRFNDIDDNSAGIGNINSALVVANEFDNSAATQEAIGAGVGGFGDYDGSTIEFNNFLGGTMINDYSDGPPITVDAPNNFFNLTAAAQAPDNVDFTPETLVIYPHN